MSKGIDRDGDYDNEDTTDENGYGLLDLEGQLGSFKISSGKLVE